MLLADYGKHVLLPEERFSAFQRPEKFIPDSPGQHEGGWQRFVTARRQAVPSAMQAC